MPQKAPPEDKILNPATGRYVLKTGAIGKKILAGLKEGEVPVQADEKILNPATGRYVLKRGAIGKKILAQMAAAAKPAPAPAAKQMKTPEEAKQILTRAIASKKARATFNETKEIEKIYDEITKNNKEKKELLKDYIYYSFKNVKEDYPNGNAEDMDYYGTDYYEEDESKAKYQTYYNKILNELIDLNDSYFNHMVNLKSDKYEGVYDDDEDDEDEDDDNRFDSLRLENFIYYEEEYKRFMLETFKYLITYWYSYYLTGKEPKFSIFDIYTDYDDLDKKLANRILNEFLNVDYEYKDKETYENIIHKHKNDFYNKIFKPNIIKINEVIIEFLSKYNEFDTLYEKLNDYNDAEDIRTQERIDKRRKKEEEQRKKEYEEKAYDSGADTDQEGEINDEEIEDRVVDIFMDLKNEMPDKVFKKWFDKYKPRHIKITYLEDNKDHDYFKKIIMVLIETLYEENTDDDIISYMYDQDSDLFMIDVDDKYSFHVLPPGFKLLMDWYSININNLRQYGDMNKAKEMLYRKVIVKFRKDFKQNNYYDFLTEETRNYIIDLLKNED